MVSVRKLLAAIMLALVFGCLVAGPASASPPLFPPEVPDPAITDGSAARALSQARAKWRKAGIRSYRMKVTRYCLCPPPNEIRVTVRRAGVVRASVRRWSGPRSVPAMFREVHRAIKAGVPELKVEYHPRFAFVKSVWVDNIRMAMDDEIGYRISGFRRLR